MQIIDTILQSACLQERPPVLIDIGASGTIHPKWKKIAPYSICLAFDADDREFSLTENTDSDYKKLFLFNRIVTASKIPAASFYLTASPYCSSLLIPDNAKLEPWSFSALFKVEKDISLPAITIPEALQQAGIEYIDWFKTDTQGTDLRLFKSLPEAVLQTIKVAEFEPGIIDAYKGEDKLHLILKELNEMQFWLSTMQVKGTQRLSGRYLQQWGQFTGRRIIRNSPCWAELTYLKEPLFQTERDALLLLVFALLERQWGFGLEIINKAKGQFNNKLFEQGEKAIIRQLGFEKLRLPLAIFKKQMNKLLATINA